MDPFPGTSCQATIAPSLRDISPQAQSGPILMTAEREASPILQLLNSCNSWLLVQLPRHFVPGYDRVVPTGQFDSVCLAASEFSCPGGRECALRLPNSRVRHDPFRNMLLRAVG